MLHMYDLNKSQWQIDLENYVDKRHWYKKLWDRISVIPFEIHCFLRSVKFFALNVWEFTPMLWKYRHWDYEYVVRFLVKILEVHQKRLVKDDLVLETPKISVEIDQWFEKVKQWENANEIYESKNQDKIKEVKNTTDKETINILTKKYYEGMIQYEQECWNEIWEHLKKYLGNWWN